MNKLKESKSFSRDNIGMSVGVVSASGNLKYQKYLWTYIEDIDTVVNRQPSIRLYDEENDTFVHVTVNSVARILELKREEINQENSTENQLHKAV